MKVNPIDRKLKFAEANMRLEGFKVSSRSIEQCRCMLKGETTADELVLKCIRKYKRTTE